MKASNLTIMWTASDCLKWHLVANDAMVGCTSTMDCLYIYRCPWLAINGLQWTWFATDGHGWSLRASGWLVMNIGGLC